MVLLLIDKGLADSTERRKVLSMMFGRSLGKADLRISFWKFSLSIDASE